MANANEFTMTSPGLLMHPTLITAKQFMKNGKPQGEPKFGATVAVEAGHPDIKGIQQALVATLRAKFPMVDIKTASLPIVRGEKEIERLKKAAQMKNRPYDSQNDFLAGKVLIKGRSKYRPGLAAIINGSVVDLTEEPVIIANKDKFFFGAECLASWNFVAYEGDERNPPVVTAYLNSVLVTGKGTRMALGARSASEAFRGYVGQFSASDPLGASPAMEELEF